MIEEISEPSFYHMEVNYGDSQKFDRSTESVDIGQLLEAAQQVKSKVLEMIQEEMIDYRTFDDVIMSGEWKSDDEENEEAKSTQIECSAQSEMDEKNESRMKIEDVTGDNATASNASIKCSRSLMSINRRSCVVSEEGNTECMKKKSSLNSHNLMHFKLLFYTCS